MKPNYRAHFPGARLMHGMLVQQGAIVEIQDPQGRWVYYDCMHPDDARAFLEKKFESDRTKRCLTSAQVVAS